MMITKAELEERIKMLKEEAAQFKTQAEANLNVQMGRIAELEYQLSSFDQEEKKVNK